MMAETKKTAPTFLGSELIRTATGVERDVMSVVLDPVARYTEEEAKKLIDGFMKKEVDDHGRR